MFYAVSKTFFFILNKNVVRPGPGLGVAEFRNRDDVHKIFIRSLAVDKLNAKSWRSTTVTCH